MVIDVHHHFMPETLLDYIRTKGEKLDTEIIVVDGLEYVFHKTEGFRFPLQKAFYDAKTRIADMDNMGINKAVLSLVPSSFFYYLEDLKEALNLSRLCNNWVAAECKRYPEKFIAMASLPMQDLELSLGELERANKELGIKGIIIAPVILGSMLDDKKFFPIYEYCEKNGVLIFLHPYFPGKKPEYAGYYNVNLVGNVFDTNVGINHMIFGGVFEQFPRLNIFASHGGGYFPYQFGRLMHGYKVRTEPKANIPISPDKYLKNIHYDTITHGVPALQFLADAFGADSVMVGTDYPFDMGDYEPVQKVNALRLTHSERESILHTNAERFFETSC